MYASYETPKFVVNILYFDTDYSIEVAQKVKAILQKNGFLPPIMMNAEKLTRGRDRRYLPEMEDYITRFYTEPNLLQFWICDANPKTCAEYCEMSWHLTFNKCPDLAAQATYKPWNVISFKTTYGKLLDTKFMDRLFCCTEEIIEAVHPFQVSMDDMAIKNQQTMSPDGRSSIQLRYGEVNSICWANYFCPEYCKRYSLMPELFPAGVRWKELLGGLLFYLSDSPLDLASQQVLYRKKEISKMLNIKPQVVSPSELHEVETILRSVRHQI